MHVHRHVCDLCLAPVAYSGDVRPVPPKKQLLAMATGEAREP